MVFGHVLTMRETVVASHMVINFAMNFEVLEHLGIVCH
jgi:hypothetical protein